MSLEAGSLWSRCAGLGTPTSIFSYGTPLRRLSYNQAVTLAAAATDAKSVVAFVWKHPSNADKRTRALLRAARFQLRGRILGRRTLAQLGDRSTIWAELHRTGSSRIVYANPPDHPEMLVWRRVLSSGDLFIDVGSNIGSYAVWAAEMGADVIALEPAADTFALLEENVAINGYEIVTIQAAAGALAGVARFSSGLDCVNRLDPDGAVETSVVTLDSIIGDRVVAGMKVDVEGFEIDVLRGCDRALAEHRLRLLQLEWNPTSLAAVGTDRQPVAALLAQYGYNLFRPAPDGSLEALADLSFGADVFACPSL